MTPLTPPTPTPGLPGAVAGFPCLIADGFPSKIGADGMMQHPKRGVFSMPDPGRPKRLSLRNLLRPTVDAQPARPALHGDQVWTYKRLEEEASRLARTWLAGGLEPGDRVAMLLPNRPEALVVYLACFKSGLAAVPLDYRYQPPQINYVLRHSGSRLLVSHADRLDDVAACDEAQHVELAAVGGD